MKTVITFGTFDMFHVGHLRILERARALGDRLVVGVSTDEMSLDKKDRYPVCPEDERLEILKSIRCVDICFYEESMDKKSGYIEKWGADILVMGSDWLGQFNEYENICEVVYFERTPSVSTTAIIERIRR
ncbi:MAG: adenylyltransferase/cytidyltransferase family protein [Bacteroidota bacterium]